MYTNILCERIQNFKNRKEFKELTGINKIVIQYILTEAEEAAKSEKIFVHKRKSGQVTITLFEITFNSLGGMYVSTRYKHGAAHIKYIRECKPEDVNSLICAIALVCKDVEWEFMSERETYIHSTKKLEIGYKIPEEATS